MAETCGELTVPITSLKHQPLGQLRCTFPAYFQGFMGNRLEGEQRTYLVIIIVHYLVTHPLRHVYVARYLMDVSYARHFKKRRQALNVGHRGMGNSYTKMSVVRENTLRSLTNAADHVGGFFQFLKINFCRAPTLSNSMCSCHGIVYQSSIMISMWACRSSDDLQARGNCRWQVRQFLTFTKLKPDSKYLCTLRRSRQAFYTTHLAMQRMPDRDVDRT
jgi:hypothetical protein